MIIWILITSLFLVAIIYHGIPRYFSSFSRGESSSDICFSDLSLVLLTVLDHKMVNKTDMKNYKKHFKKIEPKTLP